MQYVVRPRIPYINGNMIMCAHSPTITCALLSMLSNTLYPLQKTEEESLVPKPSPQRKRTSSHASKPPVNRPEKVFCRGSVTSFRKLSNFFGAEPPRLEDITTFLEGLGYTDLIQASRLCFVLGATYLECQETADLCQCSCFLLPHTAVGRLLH